MGVRVPDSALSYLLARIDPTPLREVRTMIRSKSLRPEGLPFAVLAIDRKTSWTGGHAGDVKDGHEEVVMERYFLTNLSWNALSPEQSLSRGTRALVDRERLQPPRVRPAPVRGTLRA